MRSILGAIFGGFWLVLEAKSGPKIDPKSIPKVIEKTMPKWKRKKPKNCRRGGGAMGAYYRAPQDPPPNTSY